MSAGDVNGTNGSHEKPRPSFEYEGHQNGKNTGLGLPPEFGIALDMSDLEKKHYTEGFAHGLLETINDHDRFWQLLMEETKTIGYELVPSNIKPGFKNWIQGIYGQDGYNVSTALSMAEMMLETPDEMSSVVEEVRAEKGALEPPPVELNAKDHESAERMRSIIAGLQETGRNNWQARMTGPDGKPVLKQMPLLPMDEDTVAAKRADIDAKLADAHAKLTALQLRHADMRDMTEPALRELKMRQIVHAVLPDQNLVGNPALSQLGTDVMGDVPPNTPFTYAYGKVPEITALSYELARVLHRHGIRFMHMGSMKHYGEAD